MIFMKIGKLLIPVLILALAVLPLAICAQQFPGASHLHAVDLASQGKFPEAKKIFQDILAGDPAHERSLHCLNILEDLEKQKIKKQTAVHLFKSLSYFYQDKFTDTLAEANLAFKFDPKYKRCYNARGGAYFGLGKNEEALADFNRALKIDPEYAGAFYNRGCVYIRTEEYARAICDFDQALKITPKFASAFYNRGIAHFHQGEFLWALADFNRALEINPRLAEAHMNRAVTLEELGKEKEAREAYKRFLQDAPPNLSREIDYARKRLEILGNK
ncbi:MAG: tetratricopeptide repeat protein [Deltaproteobacteria bacterium]|nr:MAG: tetratricopeptide repeat protein [Deltaproteobacteria bacterium]